MVPTLRRRAVDCRFVIRKLERRDANGILRIQKAIMKGAVTIDYHRLLRRSRAEGTRLVL